MKKLAKIFAVVMVCVLAVAVLVACGPNTNYDKAQKNLEKNDYTVVTAVKKGDTGAAIAFAGPAAQFDIKVDDIESMLYATSKDAKDSISIMWLASYDVAKKVYYKMKDNFDTAKETSQKNLDEMKANMKDLSGKDKEDAQKLYDAAKELHDARFVNTVVGKSGNVVYTGTKDAIKATK